MFNFLFFWLHVIRGLFLFRSIAIRNVRIFYQSLLPGEVEQYGRIGLLRISLYYALWGILSNNRTHSRLGLNGYWIMRYLLKRMIYAIHTNDLKLKHRAYMNMLRSTTVWQPVYYDTSPNDVVNHQLRLNFYCDHANSGSSFW